jgi:hypothetical protein
LYNANDPPKQIAWQVVGLRVKEWKLDVKTQAGKQGREPKPEKEKVVLTDEQKLARKERLTAQLAAGRKNGGKRSNKVKNHPHRAEAVAAMTAELVRCEATRFLPLVELVANGSRRAADKLFCLGCVGYQSAEVRRCSDIGCPKWLGRPFQKSAETATAEEMEAVDAQLDTEELEVAC